MLNSIRVRLTLWYVLIFGTLLVAFSIFVYLTFSKILGDRLDHSLTNAASSLAASFQRELTESQGNAKFAASETLRETPQPEIYAAIFADNQLLATNYPATQKAVIPANIIAELNNRQTTFTTVSGFSRDGARLVAWRWQSGQGDYLFLAVTPLHDTVENLEVMWRIFFIGLPAALLITGACGFLLAKKSLAPVVAMSNQVRQLSAKNLHEQVKVANSRDELGQLAAVFNELLSRLNHSFITMREFMADASHELRTPIAVIRGEADVALSQDRDAAEYKESLLIIQDEASLLSRLVDDMLALARADAGERKITVEEFYLNDLLDDCCRAAQVLALRKAISVTFDPSPDLVFRGDEDRLRRMLLNLLDNAIKYTPSQGSVAVQLQVETRQISITVTDTGIGIPAEAAAHVFERFYRVDRARSRAEGGSGLGLAIAKWVAEAHQGSLTLENSSARGSTFKIVLPR